MKRFPFVFFVILAACASQPPTTELGRKGDIQLLEVVDRFTDAAVDTTITIEATLVRTITDERRMAILAMCEVQLLDRLDTTAMIICNSRKLNCIAGQPEIRSMRMIQAWSPDL